MFIGLSLVLSALACVCWSADETQRKKRRQLPESVVFCPERSGLFSWIHISGLTSLEWLVRNARPMRWPTCCFEAYLSRQEQTIRLKSYANPSQKEEVRDSGPIQRVTHRADEFLVVERFHEECPYRPKEGRFLQFGKSGNQIFVIRKSLLGCQRHHHIRLCRLR
jgi:hypothetical protein